MRIPLHDLLLGLRQRDAKQDASPLRKAGFGVWGALWGSRAGYAATKKVAPTLMRAAGDRDDGPGWLGNWARTRSLPVVPSQSMEKDLRGRHD